jgi:hypothetical protein
MSTAPSKQDNEGPDVHNTGAMPALLVPLMTREAWARAIGIPVTVLLAQCERGYWPQITKGKRVFINVEAVRLEAIQRAQPGTAR